MTRTFRWVLQIAFATFWMQGEPAIDALHRELDAAVAAFMEDYRQASEAGQKAMLADPAREPRHRFAPRFQAGADRFRGREEAIPYLLWLAKDGAAVDPRLADRAVERLLAEHGNSPALAAAPAKIRWGRQLRGAERTDRDLTALLALSPHPAVRAEALLHRGLLRLEAAPGSAQGAADLRQARSLAPGSETASRAGKELQSLDGGLVGRPAPALAGPGLAGSSVRLEALRGQVVLVDFWGMWCGPCVGALPELQQLAERFAGRPFTVLGVSSDKDPEALRRFLAGRRIQWPQVLDGSTDGPAAAAWGVNSWPRSFLVDASGRVRGQDLAGEERLRMIEELLREAERGGSSRGL